MIQVKSLSKRFGLKTVLNQINFAADEGQCVVLMGPNGSGKTTFLRILASISRPTDGKVNVNGYSLPSQAVHARRHLGVVLHQPMLYENLSAEENLQFFARFYHLPDINQRVYGVINLVGLYHRRKDTVRTFSRGMQQRLALARAILHEPNILLLDEPYTGLDEAACDILNRLLGQFVSDNKTVILSTHDIKHDLEWISRFDILSHGNIKASCASDDIPASGLLKFYQDTLRYSQIEHDKKIIKWDVA